MGIINLIKKKKTKQEHCEEVACMLQFWKKEFEHPQFIRAMHYGRITAKMGQLSAKAESFALLASLLEGRLYSLDRSVKQAFLSRAFKTGEVTAENCFVCSSPEVHKERCEMSSDLQYYNTVCNKAMGDYIKVIHVKRNVLVQMGLQHFKDSQDVDMNALLAEFDRVPNSDKEMLDAFMKKINDVREFQTNEYFALKTTLGKRYTEQIEQDIKNRTKKWERDRNYLIKQVEKLRKEQESEKVIFVGSF